MRAHIASYAPLFRRFTDTNVHGTGSVKIWKTRHKISVDIRVFFTVYYSLSFITPTGSIIA